MPESFLNNQEVTAEDLNNIAIDLGYADYSHFPETPPQSAVSALNQITADLTSKGILLTGNCMAVSIDNDVITVKDGICVFENGAKKRIEVGESVSVPYIEGGTNYLYLLNDTAGNKIELINSLDEPTDGDFVNLAIADENKIIHSRRIFSRSKVEMGVPSQTELITFTLTNKEYIEDETRCIAGEVLDVDITKHSYAVLYLDSGGEASRPDGFLGVFNLKTNMFELRQLQNGSMHYYGTNEAPWRTEGGYFGDRILIIDGILSCITDKKYPDIPNVKILFI